MDPDKARDAQKIVAERMASVETMEELRSMIDWDMMRLFAKLMGGNGKTMKVGDKILDLERGEECINEMTGEEAEKFLAYLRDFYKNPPPPPPSSGRKKKIVRRGRKR